LLLDCQRKALLLHRSITSSGLEGGLVQRCLKTTSLPFFSSKAHPSFSLT
jgi:hypothetical protein